MAKRKKGLVLSILGIIGLIIITAGVTYAFFNYAKEGTTENAITTGTITFLYTEVSGVGRGISIDDAYPISDEVGKAQTGEGKVFDFKVTSNTPNNSSIPYEITARKKNDSTLEEKAVKLYLTKVTGDVEDEVLLANYNTLTQTAKIDSSKYTEKTIYTGKVPADSTNYEQNFRLRMWIDDGIDFSPVKDEEGNDTYPYNDKEFTVTVNVYANAKVVTGEETEDETPSDISNVAVEGNEVVKVENEDYDYETSLPSGTTEATVDIETTNETATVEIERINGLAYKESNIKRLSTKKTLQVSPGNNYFKIKVINASGKIEKEYILKIQVKQGELLSDAIFNKYTTIYENPTLTTSSNNTSDPSGLYKSTATNLGEPTYYFRGDVDGNWVDFAGFTWRVVRINEDGTIKLIKQSAIDNKNYVFNSIKDSKENMYYSNSDTVKPTLETWYTTYITNKGYSDYVESGNYYCEQAKIAYDNTAAANSGANMILYKNYTQPNFKCEEDANGKGLLNAGVGLLSYDEVLHAGGYYNKSNSDYYLATGDYFWIMSPAGFYGIARDWYVNGAGFSQTGVSGSSRLRPVINLKSGVTVTGTGSSGDHWIVQ